MNGIGIIKVFFHPSANVETALAQVTASVQTLLRQLPPGIDPPLVISYNASTVPILQLGLSASRLSEQQLFDLGFNFIRTQLATVQGASIPLPYGGASDRCRWTSTCWRSRRRGSRRATWSPRSAHRT